MRWNRFYKNHYFEEPSNFAKECLPYIKGRAIELGCGDGRDVRYFIDNGVDIFGIDQVWGTKIQDYIRENESPSYVYTRFLWHSISNGLQKKILKWVRGTIFIEARTIKDKPENIFGKHKRNLVDVSQLIEDLLNNNYVIVYFDQGRGLSPFKGEDPHLVRVIAKNV